jgi:hypothetical protein
MTKGGSMTDHPIFAAVPLNFSLFIIHFIPPAGRQRNSLEHTPYKAYPGRPASQKTKGVLRRSAGFLIAVKNPLALAACCTCGFFALDAAKNPDYRGCFRSLQGKKSPDRRFLKGLYAKRNKLLAHSSQMVLNETSPKFHVLSHRKAGTAPVNREEKTA